MPYWDSVLDQRLPNPVHSVLWSNELLGGAWPGEVNGGAFRGWLLENRTRFVRRNVGQRSSPMNDSEVSGAMNAADISDILSYTVAQEGCPVARSWRAVEFIHGKPHNYVGGDMVLTASSANDPVFYLHHSFVDLIWETWRLRRQTRSARETTYPPDNRFCSATAHYSYAPMRPFGNLVNTDGLSNHYTDIFYTYSNRLSCSASNPNCQSKYLFCDLSHGWPQCASKIVVGGNCTGFVRGEDCCYNGRCVNNICVWNANNFGTRPRLLTVPGTRIRPFSLAISPVRSSISRASKDCFNENECCSIWADNGYCTRNPSYMTTSCKASCGSCRPLYDLNTECIDRSSSCPATTEGCQSRSDWMKENCRQSCSFCNQTRLQACTATSTSIPSRTTTSPLPQQQTSATSKLQVMSCTDYHFCCAFWSTQNRCTGGQSIQQACPMSCNVCTANISSSNTDCQDFHPLCEAWANSRLCDTRQDYMWENCKWSCRKCDLLRPSSRAAACESIRRPLFRTVLRQPNASENEYVTAEEPQTPTTTTLSSY
ncbi:ShTK domain-containing protein [Trichostrongylus colubriformis]|uniref:ShTK domain-containing protein n=1 Tax=Trichostrongylus colubriformis TaxID=6319 RepID=A0AAN8F8S1_TRICO